MLKKILSISGRPGLYKLISYGKNVVVVEGVADGKRTPAHARDRIVALGDISIYTTEGDKPLGEVFEEVFKKYEGKAVDAANLKTGDQLRGFMADVLPTFDADRVHNSDIKKLISWYNILVGAGFTSFKNEEEKPAEESKEEEPKEEKAPKTEAKK